MELVEKITRRPTDLPWEQTLWGALGLELLFLFPPHPPLTGLNRFTLDDDKDEA